MDLPAYTIRESVRAKRVRLRASRHLGIEVVVPTGFDHTLIPGLLASHESWIARMAERMREGENTLPPDVDDLAPSRIVLPGSARELTVEYSDSDSARIRVSELEGGALHVRGVCSDRTAVARALQAWLRDEGKALLPSMLQIIAGRHGFEFERASIRLQRTRWGSSSSTGTISLNAKALFLAPELVEYLMLHELCHTRERNHSPRFYELLAGLEPDSESLRARMRDAWRFVPQWADA